MHKEVDVSRFGCQTPPFLLLRLLFLVFLVNLFLYKALTDFSWKTEVLTIIATLRERWRGSNLGGGFSRRGGDK
jgi:hypothetical protein